MMGHLQIDSSKYRARARRSAVALSGCKPVAVMTKEPFSLSTLRSAMQ